MASSESVLGKATILRWKPDLIDFKDFGEVFNLETISFKSEAIDCTDLAEPLIRPDYPTPDMANAFTKSRPGMMTPWLMNISLNFSDYKFTGQYWYYMLQTNLNIEGSRYEFAINIPENKFGDLYHFEFDGWITKMTIIPPMDDRITINMSIQTIGKPLFETGHL